MQIQATVKITNVFKSERNGTTYYTGQDLQDGGDVKFSVPAGEIPGLMPGVSASLGLTVRGRMGKDGGLNLTYVNGQVKPVKVTISEG